MTGRMRIIIAAAGVSAAMGSASAQTPYIAGAGPYPGAYSRGYPAPSYERADQWRYDQSGTRGRIGLGADPAHPEGPGNPGRLR